MDRLCYNKHGDQQATLHLVHLGVSAIKNLPGAVQLHQVVQILKVEAKRHGLRRINKLGKRLKRL